MSTTKKDFIAVCIITKDQQAHLLETLQHLVHQSYGKEHFEIIIVDGNSSDTTIATSTAFLEKHAMQYTIVNEKDYPNKRGGYAYGHSFARNVAIDIASADAVYIAQIDADCRADPDWLMNLWNTIKDSDTMIAGAGGPRLVETRGDISKFELMLNYYFTSPIMTLGNPAFCVRKGLKYIPSIAGYNSIYKAALLRSYMFDTTYATHFDDIAINYRLSRDGYQFLYAPSAKIWHRMDTSIAGFLTQMRHYGSGAAKVAKHFNAIPRLYVYLSVGYVLYTLAAIPLSIWVSPWFLSPFIAVFVLALAVLVENISKTQHIVSLWTIPLVFGHPWMYGWGFLREMMRR